MSELVSGNLAQHGDDLSIFREHQLLGRERCPQGLARTSLLGRQFREKDEGRSPERIVNV